MPGLVPGIHVLLRRRKKDVDGRDQPGHDDGTGKKIFFIIFIDAMFTILFEPPFTNSFDAARETPSASCV
jgi:hypothetical protein